MQTDPLSYARSLRAHRCMLRRVRVSIVCIAVVFAAATASAADAPRFGGSGMLTAPTPSSGDGRFRIEAELQAAAARSGRFAVDADLKPAAKSIATACGSAGTDIFKNGFE